MAEVPAPIAAESIVLVQGTSSLANPNERQYAQNLTARISYWLQGAGLRHVVITDDKLSAPSLRKARIVILGYNPRPPARELQTLRQFVRTGGKLMVFFGTDPDLAALMEVRLGVYQSARQVGAWHGFCFNQDAPAGVPARILQESGNFFTVYPARSSGRIFAFWEGADGQATRYPAWVKTDHGFWMTHVLLSGDNAAKQQMLVALVAAIMPETRAVAAHHAIGTIHEFADYTSTASAIEGIRAQAVGPDHAPVRALLDRAQILESQVRTQQQQGHYDAVRQTVASLRTTLTEAYARIQDARPDEFRGVWNHSGAGLYPGDWDRTCRLLADAGFQAVFPMVQSPARAHYPSTLVPTSDVFQRYGDQLEDCLRAARRSGLQVHAWKICWNLEDASQALIDRFRRANRLQRSDRGETLAWLCPSNPDNQALELESILEIARNYRVDGVHLDFIRYKSKSYCYCAGCRNRFEKAMQQSIRQWPREVLTGAAALPYQQWRRDQISHFVAAAQAALRRLRPELRLSAAVYGFYPQCGTSIGQDWGDWLRTDTIDFVCPMDYTTDPALFRKWVTTQMALPQSKGRIRPGIGVTATESRLNPVQVIDQVRFLRQAGATGFMLFDLNRTLEYETLPMLRLGLTRR